MLLTKSMEKYQAQFAWLRDRKFLTELENDSVDTEVLEEELQDYDGQRSLTVRQRVAKCLQSQPAQVVLCILVLLDAGIVIAQILLDLHYYREKNVLCENDISRLIHEIQRLHPETLGDHFNIDDLIDSLHSIPHNMDHVNPMDHSAQTPVSPNIMPNTGTMQHLNATHGVQNTQPNSSSKEFLPSSNSNPTAADSDSNKHRINHDNYDASTFRVNITVNSSIQELPHPNNSKIINDAKAEKWQGNNAMNTVPMHKNNEARTQNQPNELTSQTEEIDGSQQNDPAGQTEHAQTERMQRRHVADQDRDMRKYKRYKNTTTQKVQRLHDAAVSLHLVSIAVLGFLVIEDLIKALAMGREFCRHRMEVCDAVIITSSFIIDIVFVGGLSGEEGGKAAIVLVLLLLWRITRVVDGIVVTVKQRHELRIRLQKRARRKAEKRLDLLEEERHNKTRYVQALKELCFRLGLTEDEIDAYIPKRRKRNSSTALALNSIAQLSVSMTMSMSSGLFSLLHDNDKLDEPTSGSLSQRPLLSESSMASLLPDSSSPRRSQFRNNNWDIDCISPGASPSKSIRFAEDGENKASSQNKQTSVNNNISPKKKYCRSSSPNTSPVNCSGVRIVIDSPRREWEKKSISSDYSSESRDNSASECLCQSDTVLHNSAV